MKLYTIRIIHGNSQPFEIATHLNGLDSMVTILSANPIIEYKVFCGDSLLSPHHFGMSGMRGWVTKFSYQD